ncbi:MAG: hypothetical protein JJU36_09840 [Phycisphaeraceae bacterium]|nr:hypothetical protein [Phycisphaeraceae bacterium]
MCKPHAFQDADRCIAAFLAMGVLLMAMVSSGCGPDDQTVLVDAEGDQTLTEVWRQIEDSLDKGDRDGFERLLHGGEAEKQVLLALFDVALEVRELARTIERRHGPMSMIHEEGESSTRSLPGMPLEEEPDLEAVVGVNHRYPVRTSLWEQELMLMETDGRWMIDARASLSNSPIFDAQIGGQALTNWANRIGEAVKTARYRFVTERQPREQVLSDLLAAVEIAAMRALRDYRNLRLDR